MEREENEVNRRIVGENTNDDKVDDEDRRMDEDKAQGNEDSHMDENEMDDDRQEDKDGATDEGELEVQDIGSQDGEDRGMDEDEVLENRYKVPENFMVKHKQVLEQLKQREAEINRLRAIVAQYRGTMQGL